MGQAKQRRAAIDQLKSGQSLFRYISDKIESSRVEDKMDALATAMQIIALSNDDLGRYTESVGAEISADQFNVISLDLAQTHGIKYMPTNINTTVWVTSHLNQHFVNGLEPETLFNTMSHWMMQARDDMTAVSSFAVLLDEQKFGTDLHKESTRVAVFLNYGPVRIIVIDNKDSTMLVLSNNDQYQDDAVEEQPVA